MSADEPPDGAPAGVVNNDAVAAKMSAKAERAVDGWKGALTADLDALGRWVEGRFVIGAGADDEVVEATRYENKAFLRESIQRASRSYMRSGLEADPNMEVDPRVAVSRFTRHYATVMATPALVAMAAGVGMRLTADRCKVVVRANIPFLVMIDIDEDELVRCAERPTSWPLSRGRSVETVAELREYVWRPLFAEHLAPFFERVLELTKVAPNLMWANAAEVPQMLSDAADEYLDPERAAPHVSDRIAVLEAETLPGLDPNPMRGLVTWDPYDDPAFPRGIAVRNVCCLTYLMPDRLGRLCQNCVFVPVDVRAEMIKERHGVSLAESVRRGPEGQAVARSIELGSKKLKQTR